jgi:hypothetical protein
MKMKNTILILLITSLFVVSCDQESFLDKKPHTPTDFAFYTTEDGAVQGINAAYDVLQKGEELETRLELLGTICSGDALAGGEPTGADQPALQNIMKFLNAPSNPYLMLYWSSVYRGIYRCNLVINYLKDPVDGFDEVLRKRLIGEAKYLRALFHFKLQINFGGFPQLQGAFNNELLGVPYADHVLLKDEWEMERPSLDYTWGKIEADFAEAATLLPATYTGNDIGRATAGAAKSMLAKTYLYQEKWPQAYDAAKEVINSGTYYLIGEDGHNEPLFITRLGKDGEFTVNVPGYKWIWQPEANNCAESIFDIQHYTDGLDNFSTAEGNLVVRYYGPRRIFTKRFDKTTNQVVETSTEYFWGFILPTKYFVETAYNSIGAVEGGKILDPRFKLTVVTNEDKVPFNYTYKDENDNEIIEDSAYIDGFYSPYTTGNVTWKYFCDPVFNSGRLGDMPHNTKYFRFADLLLIGAEAAAHTGNTADAVKWINRVRNRARNAGNTGFPKDLTTVTVDDVLAERRVELAFEGHQFYDIVRTGRAEKILKTDALQFATNKHQVSRAGDEVETIEQFGDAFVIGRNEICPIPQTEIDNTNGKIAQNPGWK